MTAPTDPDVTAVLAGRERLSGALRTHDFDALTHLLADDLVVNAPTNRIVDRDDLFDLIQRGEAHQADGPSTTRVEFAGSRSGVVVIMGEEVVTSANTAASCGPIRRRFTDIWRPHGDTWQLSIRQITVIASGDA